MKRLEIFRLFPSVDPATISLLTVLDQFHEGIIISDAQGIVLYLNDAQALIDDLKADDAVGKKVTDLYRVDEGASPTMTCLNTGKAIQNFACYYRTHLGRIVNSIHNVYPIRADGRIIGTICYITDYKNIKHSFTTVEKTQHSQPVSTLGVSQVDKRTEPRKNGTRYTFGDIIGADPDLLAAVEKGMNIRTRAMKQEVAHVPAPEGLNWERDGYMLSDGDIGCYSRPEVGNHFLIGSEGPECDPQLWVDDPDNYDENFTDQWKCMVMREAMRVSRLTVPNQQKGVVSLYDVSDDWIPIYDKSDLPGFYMAIGTSGNQYKNAPVAGVMMANLIDACENGLDHDKTPYKFDFKYTNHRFDVGFFSRNREINRDSSFSVIG